MKKFISFLIFTIKSLEIEKKCDIIICKSINKNKSKDNINYIITYREPKEAGNLVSKNNFGITTISYP